MILNSYAHVLYNHLVVRQALGTFELAAVLDFSTIRELMQQASVDLAQRIRHTDDDAVERSQKPSDIANVRDRACSEIHADSEGMNADDVDPAQSLDDSGIQLDLVGVLVADPSTSVKSLFSNLRKLLSAEDHATSTDPDADAASDTPAAEDAVLADDEGAAAGSRTDKPHYYRCKRAASPLNEFTDNATLLYGSFWDLFPLRSGLRNDGPLHPSQRRHLLTQFHNSFAQCPTFLFLLASQIQRHAATKGVALRVQADSDGFEKFAAFVSNTEDFSQQLTTAEANPTSSEARSLFKYISRFVSGAGRVFPWSGDERSSEITKLYAMWRRFGPPSCFFVSGSRRRPSDQSHPPVLQSCWAAAFPITGCRFVARATW